MSRRALMMTTGLGAAAELGNLGAREASSALDSAAEGGPAGPACSSRDQLGSVSHVRLLEAGGVGRGDSGGAGGESRLLA